MRSYGWFVFGMIVAFFAAMTLTACSLDASGMGDGSSSADAEKVPLPPARFSTPHDKFVSLPAMPDHAGLTIELIPATEQRVVGIAGSEMLLATYAVRNADDAAHTLTRFTVYVSGAEATENIGFTWDTLTNRADVGVPGFDDSVTFKVVNGIVSAHSSRTFKIVTTLRKIDDDRSVLPRSGNLIYTELVSAVDEDGSEIPRYADSDPQFVFLRKSSLTVSPGPSESSLRSGWHDLAQWNVTAYIVGDVGIKQFVMDLGVDAVTLCKFRLRRNGVLVNAGDYAIYGFTDMASPVDLKSTCVTTDTKVAIVFKNEDRVQFGTTSLYALRAEISNLETFASVRTRFSTQNQSATTSIDCSSSPISALRSDPGNPPAILWTDFSERPHRSTPCLSSTDWIGDDLVHDLSWTAPLG